MSEAKKILIGGGVRSGKTAFALEYARRLGMRRVYIATAEALDDDDEMRERIARHKAERASEFDTIEEPLQLAETIEGVANYDVIIVDCLTLWLSNLMLAVESGEDIRAYVENLADTIAAKSCHVIVVTNEVGLGIVPESELGRRFRDESGVAHQRLGKIADEVYLGIMGQILRIKPWSQE